LAMQVYIEYVIINNLLINALLLTMTLKAVRAKLNGVLIFISSAIGTLYAIFLPLVDLLNFFIFKIILSALMCAIALGKFRLKRYLAVCAVFLGLTFAMGGITQGLQGLCSSDLIAGKASLLPFFVGAAGLILILSAKLIKKHIILARRKSRYENQIIISANGKEIACKAYYDSGNRLYFKNMPTIIIDSSIALQFYDSDELNGIRSKARIDTVGGMKELKVISLDYLRMEQGKEKIYGVMAAVSDCIKGEYKAVLHCDL